MIEERNSNIGEATALQQEGDLITEVRSPCHRPVVKAISMAIVILFTYQQIAYSAGIDLSSLLAPHTAHEQYALDKARFENLRHNVSYNSDDIYHADFNH